MERKALIQIVSLMLVIFAAGLTAGWVVGKGNEPKPSLVPPGPGGRLRAPDPIRLMRELDRQLELTPEQTTQLKPLAELWSKAAIEAEQTRLKARRDVFRTYSLALRTNLTPAQMPSYDRMTKGIENRFERLMKNSR
jgi:hypothetical protein